MTKTSGRRRSAKSCQSSADLYPTTARCPSGAEIRGPDKKTLPPTSVKSANCMLSSVMPTSKAILSVLAPSGTIGFFFSGKRSERGRERERGKPKGERHLVSSMDVINDEAKWKVIFGQPGFRGLKKNKKTVGSWDGVTSISVQGTVEACVRERGEKVKYQSHGPLHLETFNYRV